MYDGVVHLSDWADQPSVRIKCTQKYGIPAWKGTSAYIEGLPKGIYALDVDGEPAGVIYTFEASLVTCSECKADAEDHPESDRALREVVLARLGGDANDQGDD